MQHGARKSKLFLRDVLKDAWLEAAQRQGGGNGSSPASDTECFSRDRLGVERLRDSSEDDEKCRRRCKGLGEGLMWLVGHWVLWEGDMQS